MEFSTEELQLIDTSLGLLAADLQLLQTNVPIPPGDFAEEDRRARFNLDTKLATVRELRIKLRQGGGL